MKAKETTTRIRNSSNRPPWWRAPALPVLFLAIFAFGFFALLPPVQAVSPPPDGGYPGGNTAEGTSALLSRTTGSYNTAVGIYSLLGLTDGSFCTGVGAGALLANTGEQNTATGAGALLSNSTGSENTANGAFALFFNTTGQANTATGFQALFSNTTGEVNTANGYLALAGNNSGNRNTAIGFQALTSNTVGDSNIALGFNGGALLTTGSNNIDIGNDGVAAESGTIRIGTHDDQTRAFIAGIRGVTTGINNAIPVLIDGNGQLGTLSSSRRYKNDIEAMEQTSAAILSLKPVTFHYKSDTKGTPQFGLIAEEVAKVNPNLVVRDENGEIYTVRYDAVNAMLLNEFLKEHGKVQELAAKVARQQNDTKAREAKQRGQIQALTARLDQQAAEIQKVKAKIEVSRPTSQLARRSN